jgi:tRNA A-37 threonylcarbamoyl transferase component Bud32
MTGAAREQALAGRYELGPLLGRGAMAEVYRATDLLLDRPVAVKLFAAAQDPLDRRRSMDEGRTLARLSAPGLVTVFDLGLVDSRPYLVMELVDGPSLRDRLLAGPLTVARTTRLGAPLADALAHAHERGIVHRDVKPSNVLLDEHESPKLVDFGIALLAGGIRLTAANEIVGTPAYLSPEQVRGETVGPATDVYALGLVLLECLTGEVVYGGTGWLETALARLHRQPAIPSGLPAGLADLLTAMTSAQPADRPSAAECAIILRGPLTSTLRIAAPGRRFRWQPAVFVAAAAVAAATLIAGFVLALNPSAPTVPRPAADAMSGAVAGAGATPSTSSGPIVPAQVATTTAAAGAVPERPAQQQGGNQQQSGNQDNTITRDKIKNKGHGH